MSRPKTSAGAPAFQSASEFHRQGRLAEAESLYEAALTADPTHFEAAHSLGMLHLQRGQPDRAADHLGQALRIDPNNGVAHRDHGIAMQAMNLHDDAIASFDASIRLSPADPFTHYARANTLLRAGRSEEAIAAYDAAIALRPDYFEAIHNRANALRELDRLEEAVVDYRKAAALRPNEPVALYNLAFALQDAGHFDEAFANYNRAIGLKKDFYEARKARGSLKLLLGRMPEGFADFDWRLKAMEQTIDPVLRRIRYWSGENLQGKSIVVYGDGAFGDLVQFSRYLPLLVEQGAEVIHLAPPQFHKVLSSADLKARVVAELEGAQLPDLRCEVMSLPNLFKSDLESIPPGIDLSSKDKNRIVTGRAALPANKLNVGICWQGNPARNIDKGRSIPLREFQALAHIPGVRLVSLQRKHGLDQLEHMPAGMDVIQFDEGFDAGEEAFVDTTALLKSLDLVVTSDTATAHVAAAAGCPTWIALRYVPEWRWLMERRDSPWYPTVRLFRQRTLGHWAPVFEEIASALNEFRTNS
jgi:tetratricopeptide (TPR) repeat protein